MTKVEKGFIYSCLLFTFISEMLLSPFYPQLFSDYFQVNGVQATSLFIICCRLIVIVMTPIWAEAAKRWNFQKMITSALIVMAGCKLFIPMAHTFPQFLVISLVLLFFQSSMYLLYPAMVASSQSEGDKVKTTTTYLFVFHGSVILSGIAGSFVINQLFPLDSYYIFALIDLILAIVSYFVLSTSNVFTKREEFRKKESVSKGMKWQWAFIAYLLIVFLFYTGHHTLRPYFTVYLDSIYTISQQGLSLLYVMPSLVAIVLQFLLPKRYLQSRVKVLLISVTGITGGLLFVQVFVEPVWLFIFVRIMYGVCFFVSLAAIDIFFFQMGIGKKSPLSYSLVTSVQNTALLFSPIAALTMFQQNGGEGPFLLSGFLLIGAALCTALLSISLYKTSLNQINRGVEHSENL